MMNIQVIDDAENCVFDIFAATQEQFDLIFPFATDIAFIDEVYDREEEDKLTVAFSEIWRRRIPKKEVVGIHGILYCGNEYKK